MRFSWVAVALCALAVGLTAVLAEEVHLSHDTKGIEVVTPVKTEEGVEVAPKEEETDKEHDNESPIIEAVDKEENKSTFEGDLRKEEGNEDPTDEQDKLISLSKASTENDSVKEVLSQAEEEEKAKEAEILAQPGMRRLARYLRNFHGRQIFRANAEALAAKKVSEETEENNDPVAEERAVRRRKRVRRRNAKNKVKRHHRNRHVANRKKTSRRKTNSRSSVKRKNGKRVKSRRGNKRRYNGVSNNRRRPAGTRRGGGGNNLRRRNSTRKNKKNKKGKKKNKKQKKPKPNQNASQMEPQQQARDHFEKPEESAAA